MVNDWSVDFQNAPDPDILDLVPGFLNNREKELAELRAWIEASDFNSLARWGHSVKGISAPYGFPSLGRLAAQFEQHAKEKQSIELTETLRVIESYLAEANKHYVG